jgi:hypothetical protein
VKVIEHSGDTSAVVENEVKLMMQVRTAAVKYARTGASM